MDELKNLIKQYPELGEVLANFENRLSYLEQSQSVTSKGVQPYTKGVQPKIVMTNIRRDEYEQLKAQVQYILSKVTELRAERKKPAKRFTKYE